MLSPEKKFDFNNLFVFEMANNHQGSSDHGFAIIRAMGDIAKRNNIRAAIKLQFRDLDTFIHPAFRDSTDIKHIPRFLSTRMSEDQFRALVDETRKQGLITMCTPFDEPSVEAIERLGIEVIKIGSCSAKDVPLLQRVADSGKPVIASTGGMTLKEIDQLVSFFQHRGVHFALMHCVAIYPSPNNKLHLNQIEEMRNRYPGITVGFSTHEDPSNLNAVRVAYAKGARIFEKHVGVTTDTISLNKYSATPEQAEAWVHAYQEAADACGGDGEREISEAELADLYSLMRGVYAKKEIRAGNVINREDIFFAMPLLRGQMVSGRWKENRVADRNYEPYEALNSSIVPDVETKKDIIYPVIHAVKAMLHKAHIPLGHDFSVELSHHSGLDRFHEIGCVIIECINRDYAKKLIVQLPGQWNPVHYHKVKDETFQVLHGVLETEIEGKKKTLHPGDTLWIPRGVWHGFGTETGAIVEEVSTTSFGSDSFYVDRQIAKLARDDRKTRLVNWGRHQFDDITEEDRTRLV